MSTTSDLGRQLTARLQDVAPAGAQAVLRSTATAFGRSTATLRLQPAFLVVGAQRCGTTTLYRLLSEHPAVVRPLWQKGIGYFDLEYGKSAAWYRGHFPLKPIARRRTQPYEPVTFESSGYYMYHPLAPERIGRDLPGVRLIAMLRDPVERAYSAWKHESGRGFEDEPFERALDLEDERLSGEEDRMRADPAYQSFHHRHHSYVHRGLYAQQVTALQSAVGVDRVRVVDANRFFADPYDSFAELLEWLGLPPWRPPHVGQLNARPSAPLDPRMQQRLSDRFERADLELARLLGRDPSWRA